jgi:hypothetical protein
MFGVGAPTYTPAEIVDALNRDINAGLVDSRMKARLAELGGTVFSGSPINFGKFICADPAASRAAGHALSRTWAVRWAPLAQRLKPQ